MENKNEPDKPSLRPTVFAATVVELRELLQKLGSNEHETGHDIAALIPTR